MFAQSFRPLRAAGLVAVSLALAACATASGRAGVVNTSRMGVVKGPGVVAAGVAQVEAGYSQGERDGRTRRAYGETLLRVGVGHGAELRATFPSYLRTTTPASAAEGLGDAALALKARLLTPSGLRPGVAVTAGSTLPTGASAVGAGAAQPEAGMSAEWKLPHRMALTGLAAHRHAILADDRYGQNTLGVAARVEPTASTAVQVEYTNLSTTRAGSHAVDQLRATAAFRLTPDLQLDGWVGRATSDGTPSEMLFGLGFTRRW